MRARIRSRTDDFSSRPQAGGVSLALKAHDKVVGITHDDHVGRVMVAAGAGRGS
jgi:hypothetical protein